MTPAETELRPPRSPRPPGLAARLPRFLVPITVVVVLAAAVVAFVVMGSRGPTGTPAQQLRTWVANVQLGQSIGTLTGDDRNVVRALAHHQDTNALHTVCAVLYEAAQTANDNLPSPDTTVTQTLARAYSLEYDAGQACYRGAGGNAALLAESATDRSRALVLLQRVLARVDRVTGRSVPTTTTTGPGGTTSTFL